MKRNKYLAQIYDDTQLINGNIKKFLPDSIVFFSFLIFLCLSVLLTNFFFGPLLFFFHSSLFSFFKKISFSPSFLSSFFSHVNIYLYTNSPVSASRNGIYKQRSKMLNCRIKEITSCILDKSKYNRIKVYYFIFLVSVGCSFISIKYMKQFNFSSLCVFILNINWSTGLRFCMLNCSFGC